ncbi:MAG: hypothetical protein M1470_08980 [Bacteroidetes bacterium]|nr:hypothetical protein [Bacteroidota bacterium]MCL5737309.1 hypothetical protein [Bacteroidota bacterium]
MRSLSATLAIGFILCTNALASPSQSDWGRLVFIGHNDSSYYCFFTHRTYPGSYYNFTDSVFVCRFSVSHPAIQEMHLLTVSVYKDTSGTGHWDTVMTSAGFSLEKYLQRNHISFEFPSVDLHNFRLGFAEGNMVLGNGQRVLTVYSVTENLACLRPLLDMSRWNNVEMVKDFSSFVERTGKIVEYFRDNSTYFFVVRLGSSATDMNYFQYVVPVPSSRVWSAVNTLELR